MRLILSSDPAKKLVNIMNDPNHLKTSYLKRTWRIGIVECWNNEILGKLKKLRPPVFSLFFPWISPILFPIFHYSIIPTFRVHLFHLPTIPLFQNFRLMPRARRHPRTMKIGYGLVFAFC